MAVKAGSVDTDEVQLKDLKISAIPRGRPANVGLPLTNGRIDFAAAKERQDGRLHPAGKVTIDVAQPRKAKKAQHQSND